jgi:hypothetical protein
MDRDERPESRGKVDGRARVVGALNRSSMKEDAPLQPKAVRLLLSKQQHPATAASDGISHPNQINCGALETSFLFVVSNNVPTMKLSFSRAWTLALLSCASALVFSGCGGGGGGGSNSGGSVAAVCRTDGAFDGRIQRQ